MVVRLIVGDNHVLVAETVTTTINELVADGDRSLMLETLTEDDYRNEDGGWDPARLVDAARTPPFLTNKRVVVGRHLSRFARKDQYGSVVSIIKNCLNTTDLVLVWEKGVDPKMDRMPGLPKALDRAARSADATVVRIGVPTRAADGRSWLRSRLEASSLSFDRGAVAAVTELLGEDRSRVVGLVRTLEGALGEGSKVTAADIATYGGDPGSAAPWALSDALDSGDVVAALELLQRLIPYEDVVLERNGAVFRLVSLLHRHYANMLRLDGAEMLDDEQAAALLNMKGSTFPAKKALRQTRRLGSDRIHRAIDLLAEADLTLRGTKDWPPELVAEVLVVRLAYLSRGR